MNRRQFLKTVAFTPIGLLVGAKLVATIRPYPLQEMQTVLRGLRPDRLYSTGSWNVSQIFQHCAQSIRFSILGYPQQYSALFQHTVGAAALNVFNATGTLHHPLDEAIPGAPALNPELPNDVALRELMFELQQFIAWQGKMAPHFAYGNLSKAQYYGAHYLHLKSHLAEIAQR